MSEEKSFALERVIDAANLIMEAGFSRQVWEQLFAAIDLAYEEMEEN